MTRSHHDTMVRNITRAFRKATPAHMAAGLGWYAEAYRVAAQIWPERPDLAAGVIAALSPRCQWSTNQVWAAAVVHAARTGQACPAVSTMPNRRTAWAIANGESPVTALGTFTKSGKVKSGMKIRAFWANIMGDQTAVTCDVWAVYAALGYKDESMVKSPANYARVAAAYRHAARILSRTEGRVVSPREVQAAVWVSVRGSKPSDAGFHAAAAA